MNSTCPAGVKTELGRDIMDHPITTILGSAYISIAIILANEEAKTLIYATLTRPEESGKYFTFSQSDEEYSKFEPQDNEVSGEGRRLIF